MKFTRFFSMALGAMLALPIFTSCLDDNDYGYPDFTFPNAIVTVKPEAGNSEFYIQVDDENTAKLTNYTNSPFGDKEVRALAYLIEDKEADHEGYDAAFEAVWIDSILTKTPVNMLEADKPDSGTDGDAEGASEAVDYGNDPIGILDSPFTLVEDGYLTIHFRTVAGYQTKHWLNLLINTDEKNPYVVEFRQKTEGDAYYGEYRDGFVAFRLKDFLPDTNGKTEKITVKWKDLYGRDRVEELFDYCTPVETEKN